MSIYQISIMNYNVDFHDNDNFNQKSSRNLNNIQLNASFKLFQAKELYKQKTKTLIIYT